jgi:ferric enterobactin receptor
MRKNFTYHTNDHDIGLFKSNEQRITTRGSNYDTSTNYIQKVDIFRTAFNDQLSKLVKKLKYAESELGEK